MSLEGMYVCHRPQLVSGADLSAKVGYFVKKSGSTWVICTGADAEGVLVNGGAASGDKVEVAAVGFVTVIAGGTVTSGMPVKAHTDGTAVDGSSTTDRFGVCYQGGSAGDEIRCFIWGDEL